MSFIRPVLDIHLSPNRTNIVKIGTKWHLGYKRFMTLLLHVTTQSNMASTCPYFNMPLSELTRLVNKLDTSLSSPGGSKYCYLMLQPD